VNSRFTYPGVLLGAVLLCVAVGCQSYVQRMVVGSLERIGEPVEPPPHLITTPMLPDAELAVGWVGHATVLIQIHDKLFLTDPLFTDYIGMLVKRYVGPGLDPSILPKLDFTLVSHIHFDHLSYGSLDQLPKGGALLVPRSVLPYTPDFGFKYVAGLEPWEVFEEDGVRITSVPVQHFSGRYGIDRKWMPNEGFTGYVIEYKGYAVFFGGDTGYNETYFKEIGRRFKIDVAILPIAPGSLRSVGGRVHVGPVGAIAIYRDVGAKYLLPMHNRTMMYRSDQDPMAAIEALRTAAAEQGILDRIVDLDIGEQRVLVPEPHAAPVQPVPDP